MAKTIKQIAALFCIELIILLPVYFASGLTVSNVGINGITDSSAAISWATDEDSDSKVYYGKTSLLGYEEANDTLALSHILAITNLTGGTLYYYIAASCNANNNCTNSTMESFATIDSEPPFINIEIPSYYNGEKIDLEGATEAGSVVRVYIDGELKRQLIADAYGNFVFYDIELGSHGSTTKIKMWVSDASGNIAEKEFSINIDTVAPALTISSIPSFTAEKNLTINGNVDEQAIIRFFVEYEMEDKIPPAGVTGLINGTIGPNSIMFSWDENNDTDFDKYIIYRSDIGAIATTSSKSYTSYTDVLVNSNTTYSYQVSAIDKNGNEGSKSNALTVTTLPGIIAGMISPNRINVSALAAPETLNLIGPFNQALNLDKGDGSYKIKIEAIDLAGNSVAIENETLLDTTPISIVNLTPRSGSFIYENFADEITIEGDVKPNVIVSLFINKSGVGGEDYTTATDEKGHFRFEEIDVTPYFTGSIAPQEVSPKDIDETWRSHVGEFIRKVYLNFAATDNFGRNAKETIFYNIGTCWSGNFSYNIMPLLDYQSPTFLSTERLAEGTEAIYFLVNLTYIGPGTKPNIESITFSKACDDINIKDPEYNYSCKVMPSSCTQKCNQAKTVCYVTCPLSAIEDMNGWLTEDWESFFKSINNEFVFPFRTRINYNYNYEGQVRHEYQTTCFSTTYTVDNSKINFKDALPDWLLYDFVGWLNESIKTVNEWIDDIKDVLEIVGTGCVVSFVTKFALQVYRRITCHYDNIERILEKLGGGTWDNENACKTCIEKEMLGRDWKSVKQDEMSDTCLNECQPKCSGAWKAEEMNYQVYRWTCDRFFGHSTPSGWTKSIKDEELYQKKQEVNLCKKDQSVMGQPIRAAKCKDIAGRYSFIFKTYTSDTKCFEIRPPEHANEYYIYDDLKVKDANYDLYELGLFESRPTVDRIYAVKQTEDNYLTAQPKTCEEVCGVKGAKSVPEILKNPFEIPQAAQKDTNPPKKAAWCTTVNQCRGLKEKYGKGSSNQLKVESSTPKGFTSDCFYDPQIPGLNNAKVVSDNPDERMECCCVNAESGSLPNYYQPTDIEKRGTNTGEKAAKLEEMKWSYRYWKIKWEAPLTNKDEQVRNEYNPDRYIQERDQPACFGQDLWLSEWIGQLRGSKNNQLAIEPAKQWDAAFQCLAISQIYNRLVVIRNIMNALYNCLITVRTTGTADTGVCKELFSQYVCSLMWDLISKIQGGCMPGFLGDIDHTKSENQIAEAVSTGTSGLWKSVADSQQELMNEYGNAQLQNLLGIGEEGLARKICLAAFGYDWDLDLEDVIDVAYANTYASLVQAVTKTREYLTFDPSSLQGTYEYRASWVINPGCDIENYNVYLACVTPNEAAEYNGIDCSYQGDPLGSNCDCYNKADGKEETKYFYDGRGLKQNVLEEIDKHEVITAPYRYDHLKFKLTPSHTIKKELRDQCFPEGHEDGIFYFPLKDRTARDIAACRVDPTTGIFGCEEGAVFWGDEGLAYFAGVDLDNDKDYDDERESKTYYMGDTIYADLKVYKDVRKYCLVAELRDGNNQLVQGSQTITTLSETTPGTYIYPTGNIHQVIAEDFSHIDANIWEEVPPGQTSSSGSGMKRVVAMDKNVIEGLASIKFFDDDGNKIGERYEIVSGYTAGDRTGQLVPIDERNPIYLNGFAVTFENPKVENKEKEYTFKTTAKTSGEVSHQNWKLHLDLRNPKTQDGSCDEVLGPDYEKSAIVVKGGQRQEHNINIALYKEKATGRVCTGTGDLKQDKECICDEKNIKESKAECGGKHPGTYCYKNRDTNSPDGYAPYRNCHSWPRCSDTIKDDTACDCDENGQLEKEKGKLCEGNGKIYCYDNNPTDNNNGRECTDTPPATADKTIPEIIKENSFIITETIAYALGNKEIQVKPDMGFRVYVTDDIGVTVVKVSADGESLLLECKETDKKRCAWEGTWRDDQLSPGSYTLTIEAGDESGRSAKVEQKINVAVLI